MFQTFFKQKTLTFALFERKMYKLTVIYDGKVVVDLFFEMID